jgi:hypothetical protein
VEFCPSILLQRENQAMVNTKMSQFGCQLNPGSRDLDQQRVDEGCEVFDQQQAEVSADTIIQNLQTNKIARTKITQAVGNTKDCIGLSEEVYSGCITWLDRAIYSYQTSPFIVGSKSQKQMEPLFEFFARRIAKLSPKPWL